MTLMTTAHYLIRAADLAGRTAHDLVTLTYEARFLRRKRLESVHGISFLVNLAETLSLNHGDCFELGDGTLIEVIAAEEPVVVVTGDLARLAWHIGNRHTPCQIERDRLLIAPDHVIEAMLVQLGATLSRALEPFTPEGGAYGHGRTLGHSHGGHDHGPAHDHALGFQAAGQGAPLFPFAVK